MVAFNPVCIEIKNKYEVSFCTDEKGRKKKQTPKTKQKQSQELFLKVT